MLTTDQIGELASQEFYKVDRQYYEDLRFQITGKSSQAQIEIIRGFESKHIKEIRDKYSTPINWLWEWILQPVNKIFSSNGGSIIINDSNDQAKENLLLKTANIRNSGSLRKWMQNVWREAYITCPSGIIMMEYDNDDTWPVFYPISQIKNYKLNGRFLDWVLFAPFEAYQGKNRIKLIRYVDSTGDYVYKLDGKKATLVSTYTDPSTGEEKQGKYALPKQFEKVNAKVGIPAFIVGDIPDNTKEKISLSVIDRQLSLGMEYYQLDTIRVFTAIKNGYGTYYWYTRPCKDCNGNGYIGEERTEDNTCKTCGGAGRIYPRNVNDIYLIDVNSEDKLPEKPGGVIEGDISGWKQYVDQLNLKSKDLELSHWGTHRTETGQNNTATGAFVDVQTANDKANVYRESAQTAESIIFRYMGAFYSSTFETGYIIYGNRHYIENPDTIWKRYEDARRNGAPESSLNKLLLDYYESEYRDDYQNRTRLTKLMAVEPFVHQSILDVQNSSIISIDEKNTKLYFSEWENTLLPSDIKNNTVEQLKDMLNKYIKDKIAYIESQKIEDVSNENDPEAIKIKSQAELRGSVGGVTALIELQKSVAQGFTNYDAAVATIVEIYGIEELTAKKMLGKSKDLDTNQNKEDEQKANAATGSGE